MLNRLSEAIHESVIAHRIDEPIGRALNEYLAAHDGPASRAEFLDATADLLCAIYRRPPIGIEMSLDAAKDEVVHLLESGYQGVYVDGFEGAVMDTTRPGCLSPSNVWRELANLIKAQRRLRYMSYVKAKFLDNLDWPTRLAMTEILMARCREWLPVPLQSLPCELVVDEVLTLLRGDQVSDDQLRQIAQGSWEPSTDPGPAGRERD